MKWIMLIVTYIASIIVIKYANRYIHKMSGVYFADIVLPFVYIPIINWFTALTTIIIAIIEFFDNIEISIKDDRLIMKIVERLCKVVH